MRFAVYAGVVFGFFCSLVSADTRVIVLNHIDGYSIGEQEALPEDEEYVYWIGENQLQLDRADHSFIVRRDIGVLLFVDHVDQSYVVLELPIVRDGLIPTEFDGQILEMLTFDTTINPSDHSKGCGRCGERDARSYEVLMTSQAITLKYTEWATKDVPFDYITMASMYENVVKLQFVAGNYIEESRKIDGFSLAGEGEMSIPAANVAGVGLSWFTKQIEELDPPPGTYVPPLGYVKKPFDFMAMFERLQ